MIEFTHDGPFSENADPLFPDRVRIIGLGQTGASVCDQLVLHGRATQDLWVFDSDQQAVDASIVPNRHLLGRDLVHGLGCSGDFSLAREIVALEESRLSRVAHGCDFLILALGLAGGTGMALAEYFIEEGHRAGAKVIVVGVQPFAFEGWGKRENAVRAVTQLRRDADSVLVFSHDRLSEDPITAKNVRLGFHLMHQLMAQTAQALAQVVCKRGLVQLSFADVRCLYGRYGGTEVLENCWAAFVEGDIHDRPEDLVDQLLSTPLICDESIWKLVDHAMVIVSGTRDFGLSDVQELVGLLKGRLPINLPIATSANFDEEDNDKVRLTLLLARTAPVPVAAPVAAKVTPKIRPASRIEAPKPPTIQTPPPVAPPVAAPVEEAPAPVVRAKVKPAPAPLPVVPEEEPIPAPDIEPVEAPPPARVIAKQEEMQFDGPPRGRFEKTHETIYNGENLDQPTFRRRRLVIRL